MTVAPPGPSLAASAPLLFRRLPPTDGAAMPSLLGARTVGDVDGALHAPLLAPVGARLDAWLSSREVTEERHGDVLLRSDGHWLHGSIVITESALGLQADAQRAYAALFDALAASDCPHLLRLWNYFAGINRPAPDGVERYRHFNTGRQQAFLDARRSAFDGAPAACALGMQDGPLVVQFLAGRQAPIAIENPRQVSAYRYPDRYGPRAPTFSRAAVADLGGGRDALFISGTASILGHETVHLGDVRRQTEESLANIAAVREAAEARSGRAFPIATMACTVYVRHPADLPVVREVFERAVGRDSPAAREAVYLQADICREELLVEIEAHGITDARSHA